MASPQLNSRHIIVYITGAQNPYSQPLMCGFDGWTDEQTGKLTDKNKEIGRHTYATANTHQITLTYTREI